MGSSGAERRRHPRFGVQIPVRIRRPGSSAAEEVLAINISASGMLLQLPDPPPAGSRLSIALALGERGTPFRAEAEVMRHQERDGHRLAGVRFVGASAQLRELIDRLASDIHTFGDFQIEALLGRGGMAEVYRATARGGDHIFERVALKRIRPELLRSNVVRKFFRAEGALAKKLHHPNIVETYEVGEREGIAYFVMELVAGCDLERLLHGCHLHRIALPIDFAAYVAHTMAVALDHAHTLRDEKTGAPLNIVHRDVGPSNVFISDRGVIKVGDFGVAHFGDLPEPGESRVVGKPSYQSPEQIRGFPPHPSMDVFAVGAVLFELLTGGRAFPLSPGDGSLPRQFSSPPSARARRPEISEALEGVLQRALAPEIEGKQGVWGRLRQKTARYASAGALAEALGPCFDPTIGNALAIAAVVRGILGRDSPSRDPTSGRGSGSGALDDEDSASGAKEIEPEQ